MANLADIENDAAFGLVNMSQTFKDSPYVEQFLEQFFEFIPASTKDIVIEKKGSTLSLIPFSSRGDALAEASQNPREMVYLPSGRLAKGSTIQASELSGLRAMGKAEALATLKERIDDDTFELKSDMNISLEYLRLAALQGKVLDPKDGTEIVNFYEKFGVTQSPEVNFDLSNDTSDIKLHCQTERNRIIKASGGAVTPQTQVVGLCDFGFWTKLTSHPQVVETYLNQAAASELRNSVGNLYDKFLYGNILWYHYRGTDDEKVAIGADKCRLFPTGVRKNLVHSASPADEFEAFVNKKGQKTYSMVEPDPARNKKWTRLEIYSYPLMYVARPLTLGSGRA